MKERLRRQLLALFLTVAMLISSSVAVCAEEISTELPLEETTEEVVAEEEIQIQRIVGSTEFENEKDKLILYVATDGDDNNEGTIDRPLKSLEGAQMKIRDIKKTSGIPEGGAIVYFRGGTYKFEKGVKFTNEDSGTENARITYRNYPDEKVDFVGAETLSWDDFEKVTDEEVLSKIIDKSAREHIYAADLKALGFKELNPPRWPGSYSYWSSLMRHLTAKYGITKPASKSSELFINDKTMTIARYPNEGYMTIKTVIEGGVESTVYDNTPAEDAAKLDAPPIEVEVADKRILEWEGVEGAIMYGTFSLSWATHATELGSVNKKTNSIVAKYPMFYPAKEGQTFYVYNLIEELDTPGEYYIDIDEGMLYLYELDEEIENISYTTLEDIMITIDNASYLTFKNLNMKYIKNRAFDFLTDSHDCELIGAEVAFTDTGLTRATYVWGKNNKVLDCWYHDNDGGVELAGGDRPTLTRSNNLLENSKFERNDRLTTSYSPAIHLTRCGNIVRNCDVSNAQHSLILVAGNYQEISYCNIYDACKNADDMGAIYAGRNLTERGNKIFFNYIHDIGGGLGMGGQGCHGLFWDDWGSAADIAGNIFENIPKGAAVMLAGSYNVMDNNIAINCMESFRLTRSFNYGNPDNFTVYHETTAQVPVKSELWMNAFPGIENVINEKGEPDMNNYIVATDNVLINTPLPTTSEQVKKTATLENNVTFSKDPGFYDMENRNYLLNEDSEVFEKIPDFEQIPFTRIGMYSDRAMSRIKDAYVFCVNSPYVYKNAKRVKNSKNEAIIENDTLYVPLRSGAEAIGANVDFNEETNAVIVSVSGKAMEFVSNGSLDSVKVNGEEYKLSKSVINKEYTNYISLEDLVNIFEKHLVLNNNIAVVSDIEKLFTMGADDGLLRYIEEQLTIY